MLKSSSTLSSRLTFFLKEINPIKKNNMDYVRTFVCTLCSFHGVYTFFNAFTCLSTTWEENSQKQNKKKTMGPVHVLRSCGDFLMFYNMSFHSLKIWASSFLPNEAAAEVRVLEELFHYVICQGIELLCNVFEFPLH